MSDASGPPGSGNLPARRLSSQELEAVIRRAVELQTTQSGAADDGIAEAEVMRIGQELGLDPGSVRQAITEVRGQAPSEKGAVARVMGPRTVRAGRTVRRPAAEVGLLLEEYLLKCEYMVVQRRFADRTRYVRAQGVAASFGRAKQKIGAVHRPLDLPQLDVAVSAVDENTSFVEVSVDLTAVRGGLAGAGAGIGTAAAAGIAAFALATPIVDPVALLGIPAFAGTLATMRGIFGIVRGGNQERLESFMDRLEHGELKVPASGGGGPWGGQGGGVGLKINGFGLGDLNDWLNGNGPRGRRGPGGPGDGR